MRTTDFERRGRFSLSWKPRRAGLLTLTSVLLAIAPKCPICFLAYFGIFGVATTTAPIYRAWLPPVAAMWLALTVGMLALKKGERRKYGPIALGIIAAFAVFAGKFIWEDTALIYAGIAALVGAVIWRSWRSPTSSEPCVPCERFPVLNDHERR